MGYIIDFGHDKEREYLNYILRLRGSSSNGIIDLAGNSLNTMNCTVDQDEFINLNYSGILYNTKYLINKNEDFTISYWIQNPTLPTNNSITSSNGATTDQQHWFFHSHNFAYSANTQYGDFAFGAFSWVAKKSYFMPIPTIIESGVEPDVSSLTLQDYWTTELHHCAITRENNIIRGFFNGIIQNTWNYDGKYFRGIGDQNIIGSSSSALTAISSLNNYLKLRPYWNGRFKDLCIIKGKALWTSNFTPPSYYLPDKW